MIEHLPSVYKDLSPILSTTKNNRVVFIFNC